MDEVVGVSAVMNGKCVRLRRGEHMEVATDPVHRQDLPCPCGDAARGSEVPVRRKTDACDSDEQQDDPWSSHRPSTLRGLWCNDKHQ